MRAAPRPRARTLARGALPDNSCARQRSQDHTRHTAVTFHLPGDYPFTCTMHATMQTTVHVR